MYAGQIMSACITNTMGTWFMLALYVVTRGVFLTGNPSATVTRAGNPIVVADSLSCFTKREILNLLKGGCQQ